MVVDLLVFASDFLDILTNKIIIKKEIDTKNIIDTGIKQTNMLTVMIRLRWLLHG